MMDFDNNLKFNGGFGPPTGFRTYAGFVTPKKCKNMQSSRRNIGQGRHDGRLILTNKLWKQYRFWRSSDNSFCTSHNTKAAHWVCYFSVQPWRSWRLGEFWGMAFYFVGRSVGAVRTGRWCFTHSVSYSFCTQFQVLGKIYNFHHKQISS